MASLTNLLTIIAVTILGFLSISSTARPCKTILITSYSITFKPAFTHENHPNFISSNPNNPNLATVDQNSQGYVTIFSSSSSSSSSSSYSDVLITRPYFQRQGRVDDGSVESVGPLGMLDSLRDRTKDVLSVVIAMLLGVCCGALTSGVVYLFWFFVSGSNGASYDGGDYEEDEEDDDVFNPKKSGYVVIPSEVDSTPPKQVDIAIQATGN